MFKDYYYLTKPGIIRGNAVTTAAGFLLAAKGHIELAGLAAVLVGSSLVIASACVFNNYIDRDIDRLMARTKKRALVTGNISGRIALTYAAILGLIGFLTLILFTNLLTTIVGLLGLFFYVVIYGIFKRKSVHGTLVGTISGALPPVAGYTAATNNIDSAAVILFFILVFWQMPHFYAIAMYRLADYKAASIPVLPAVKGELHTKIQMTVYVVVFLAAVALLYLFDYTGYTYLVVMGLVGSAWLRLSLKGFKAPDSLLWGRKMFVLSLIVLTVWSILISAESILP